MGGRRVSCIKIMQETGLPTDFASELKAMNWVLYLNRCGVSALKALRSATSVSPKRPHLCHRSRIKPGLEATYCLLGAIQSLTCTARLWSKTWGGMELDPKAQRISHWRNDRIGDNSFAWSVLSKRGSVLVRPVGSNAKSSIPKTDRQSWGCYRTRPITFQIEYQNSQNIYDRSCRKRIAAIERSFRRILWAYTAMVVFSNWVNIPSGLGGF